MPAINGINHVMLICRDMDTTINFYVNILGFKVKATTQTTMAKSNNLASEGTRHTTRLYFLEMTGGTMLVLGEVPDNHPEPSSPAINYYWPGAKYPFTGNNQLDHLAFNVDDVEQLEWFRARLEEHGVEVSELLVRDGRPKFVKSIYFFDPDHTPLEIATWDYSSPEWEDHRDDNYYLDPEPVASAPDYVRAER